MSATVGGTNYAWHYSYDGRGLCNKMTSPAGTVNYSYQDNGALASREILNTSSSVISHTSYTYNEVGMLETLTNKESSSGATRSSYDLSAANSYDGVFNMKACVASITGLSSLSGTLGWTVDSKDRLTDEAVTSGSRSSGSVTGTNAYDLAANLTTLRGTSGITHNSNNQITPSTGQWAYDGMGNPTKFRGRDCTYDLPGRMATMRDGNNWSMGYKYRSDGLIGSRAKTIYVLSRTGQWTPVTGNPTYFLHDGGEPLFELAMGSNFTTVNAINVRGPDGLVARKFGSNWTYYTFDQQGSVSQRLNSSGVVQSSSVYDAYGKETNNGSPSDPFGYNAQWGYWLDRETGMYLCQARWYDPVTARWVNRDPIGYAGGANLYGYCGGGPVGAADPSGLDRLDDFLNWGSNFFGGWGDALTFGGTQLARQGLGVDDYVDQNSGWYKAGTAAGTVHGMAIMPGSAAGQGGKVLIYSGGGARNAHAMYQATRRIQLQRNIAQGRQAEIDCARVLIEQGRRIEPVTRYERTPVGRRKSDWREVDEFGQFLQYIEVKSGNARYPRRQREADAWLAGQGRPTEVIRMP